jgi:endonuclease V-like protein UPF0215 family
LKWNKTKKSKETEKLQNSQVKILGQAPTQGIKEQLTRMGTVSLKILFLKGNYLGFFI